MKTVVELCAGAGGQSLGLEAAGYEPLALVEVDPDACRTLRHNRSEWNVLEDDLTAPVVFRPSDYKGADMVAGGLPCPPFSIAGKQLGELDERNLFPAALEVIADVDPKAIMFENVKGLLSKSFAYYRNYIEVQLGKMGYVVGWKLLRASDFGVPQLRPRVVMVGLKSSYSEGFDWPEPFGTRATVGEVLRSKMASLGWAGAEQWADFASDIAPTLVGGSKKHGGPDLGPTRAREAWARLGVDGRGLADAPPSASFTGVPRLTVEMAALIQGFPSDWVITGKKTAAYRQVGNAFPPPVARAVARSINTALVSRSAKAKGLQTSVGETYEMVFA